jgi:hypothetical protein
MKSGFPKPGSKPQQGLNRQETDLRRVSCPSLVRDAAFAMRHASNGSQIGYWGKWRAGDAPTEIPGCSNNIYERIDN